MDLRAPVFERATLAIEMIASYGMPVGGEVFDTVLCIGCFTARDRTIRSAWLDATVNCKRATVPKCNPIRNAPVSAGFSWSGVIWRDSYSARRCRTRSTPITEMLLQCRVPRSSTGDLASRP